MTTAQALEHLVSYPVFHNHLVVDMLTTVFPFGSEPFVRLREQFWLQVFSDAARSHRSLTFTFSPEVSVSPGFPDLARNAVESAGGRVRFMRLLVSDVEQERRIGADSRRAFHKLTDLNTLRRLRSRRAGVEQPPADLVVDTDTSSASETASLIVTTLACPPKRRRSDTPVPTNDRPRSGTTGQSACENARPLAYCLQWRRGLE